MKALQKLQGSIIVQAAAEKSAVSKFSHNARLFIMAGALVVTALAGNNAHAQNQVLTPSNCSGVGAVVGGAGATMLGGNSDAGRVMAAALGGLAGAAIGNWLCSPPAKDSSYNRAVNYGTDGQSAGTARTDPKAPLSITEDDRLEAMSQAAVAAKITWKRALYDIDYGQAGIAGREKESSARRDFENKRMSFATTVAKFNAGSDTMPPKAVGRYLEVSAALLEIDTESRMSYQALADKDQTLMQRSQAYSQEVQAAGRSLKL